tara:strand:- start:722 stop:1051 length:330 start_codon:yes stop_codon:yes gene_type:complete
MLKKLIILSLILILTNCGAPGTALLGPTITGARTGSVAQASLSYGSSHVVKKAKESLKKIEETKKAVHQRVGQLNQKIDLKVDQLNKVVLKNHADLFFKAVKDNLKKYN